MENNEHEKKPPLEVDVSGSELKERTRDQSEKNDEISEANGEKKGLPPEADASGSELKAFSREQQEENEETSEEKLSLEEERSEAHIEEEKLPHDVDASGSELKVSSMEQPKRNELTSDTKDEKKELPPQVDSSDSELMDSFRNQSENNEETSESNCEKIKLAPEVDASGSELKVGSSEQAEKNEETSEANCEKKKPPPEDDSSRFELKISSRDQTKKNEETSEANDKLPSEVDASDSELKDSFRNQPEKNDETSEATDERKELPSEVDASDSELKDSFRNQSEKNDETSEANDERKELPDEVDSSGSEIKISFGDKKEQNEETLKINVKEEKPLPKFEESQSELKVSSSDGQEKNEETSGACVRENNLLPENDGFHSEVKDSSIVEAKNNGEKSEASVEENKLSLEVYASGSPLKNNSSDQAEKNEETYEVNASGIELNPQASVEVAKFSLTTNLNNTGETEADSQSHKREVACESQGFFIGDIFNDKPEDQDAMDSDPKMNEKATETACESQGFSIGDTIIGNPNDDSTKETEPRTEWLLKSEKSVQESKSPISTNCVPLEDGTDERQSTPTESDSNSPNKLNEDKWSRQTLVNQSTNDGKTERAELDMQGSDSNFAVKQKHQPDSEDSVCNSIENLKSDIKDMPAVESSKNSKCHLATGGAYGDHTSKDSDVKEKYGDDYSPRNIETQNEIQLVQPTEKQICESQGTSVIKTLTNEAVTGVEKETNSLFNEKKTVQEISQPALHHDENVRTCMKDNAIGNLAHGDSESPINVESKDVEDDQMQIKISEVCSLSTDISKVETCNHIESSFLDNGKKQSTVKGSWSLEKDDDDTHNFGNTTNADCEITKHRPDKRSSTVASEKSLNMGNLEIDDPGLVIDEEQVYSKPDKDFSDDNFEWKGKQSSKKGKSPEKGKISIGYSQKNDRYKCFLCNEVGSGTSFEEHIMQHILWKPYKCLYCGQFFITRADIGKHVADAHNGKSLKCGLRAIKKAREFMKTAKKDGGYNYLSQKLNGMYWSCRQTETVTMADEKATSPCKTENELPPENAQVDNLPSEALCVPVAEEKHDDTCTTTESSVISNNIQPRSHDFVKQLSRPDINKLIAMYKDTDVKTVGENDIEITNDKSQVEIEVEVDLLKNSNSHGNSNVESKKHQVSKSEEAKSGTQFEPIEVLDSPTDNQEKSGFLKNDVTVLNTEAQLVLPKSRGSTNTLVSSDVNKGPTPESYIDGRNHIKSKSEIAKHANPIEPFEVLDSPTENVVLCSILSSDASHENKKAGLTRPTEVSRTSSQASSSEMNRRPSSGFQVVNQIPLGGTIAQKEVKLMSPPLQRKSTHLSPPILVPISVNPIVYPGVLQSSHGNNLSTKSAVLTSPLNSSHARPSTSIPTSNVVTFISGQQIVQNVQFLPQNVAPPLPSTTTGQNCAYRLVYIPNQPLPPAAPVAPVAPVAAEKLARPPSTPERQYSKPSSETAKPSVPQKEIIGIDVRASSAPQNFPLTFRIGCVKENYVCCACRSKYKQEASFRGHLWNHLHPTCRPCELCKQKDGGNGRKIIACEKTDNYIEILRKNKVDAISHVEVQLSPTEKTIGPSGPSLRNMNEPNLLNASIQPPASSRQSSSEVSTSDTTYASSRSCSPSRDNLSNPGSIKQPGFTRADVSSLSNENPVPNMELSTGSNTSCEHNESDVCSTVSDSNRKESEAKVATTDDSVVRKQALPNTSSSKGSTKPSRPSTKWHFYVCGAFCGFSSLYSNDFKKHIIDCSLRNSLSCAHCQYFAETPDALMRHLAKHYVAHTPGLALHSCFIPTCRFRTNILQGFYQHVTGCHPNPPRYMCSNCKDVFQSLDLLMEHLQKSLLHVVSCKHCNAKDLTKSVIISHIKDSHPDKGRMTTMVKQLLCKDRKDNEETLDKQTLSAPHSSADISGHVSENVGDQVELEIDRAVSPELEQDSNHGKQKQDPESMSNEILPLSLDPVFECCVCSYVGADQKDLNTHMPKHASNSAAKTLAFSCPECPEEFNLLSFFENHLKKHEENLRYDICSCLICKMKIGSREEIERHIKANHQTVIGSGREFIGLTLKVSNPDVYKCHKCSYKCLGNSTLQEHLQRHKDGKLVPKEAPGKEHCVHQQSDIPEQEKTVMKISSKSVYVKPLKCIKCSFSSAYKSNIQKHVSEKHPDVQIVQLYNCVTSPKGSAPPVLENIQQSTEENLKIGSGLLDTELEWLYENHCTFFRCLFCSKEISKKNLLHNHLLDHLHISLWKCPLCDFKTSRRIVISAHVMEVHKAEKSVEEIIPLIDEIRTEVKRVLGDLKGHNGLLENLKPPLGTKEMDEELKQQYKRIGNKKRICKICDAECQSSYAIHSHILRMHIKQLLFSCSYCEFSAIDRYSVSKHLTELHSTRKKVVNYSSAKIRKRKCKNGKPASNCEEGSRKQKLLVSESVSGETASTSSTFKEQPRDQNDSTSDAQSRDKSSSKQSFHPHADDEHCGIRIGSDSLHQRLFGLYSLKKGKSKILQCKTCPSEFFSRYTLHLHLLRHLGVNLVGCPYCELEAIEKKDVIDHIGSVHEGHKVHFQFLKVDLEDVCKNYFQSHLIELPKQKQSPSKSRPSLAQLICGRKTKMLTSPKKSPPKSPEKQPMNVLCITKGSLKKFKCRLCDYLALTKTSVQRHVIQSHTNEEKNEVKIAAKKSTLPDKMTCNFCPFSSTMAEILRSHYKDKHPQNVADQKEVSKCTTKAPQGHQIKSSENEKVVKRRDSGESTEEKVLETGSNPAQKTDKATEKEVIEQIEDNVADISESVKLRKRKEISIHEPSKETTLCKKRKLESEEQYQCPKCPFKTTKNEAVKHLEAEHGIKRLLQCAYCKARYYFIDELKNHISFFHKGKSLKFKTLPLDLMLEKVKTETEKQESTESVKDTKFTKPTGSSEAEGASSSTSDSQGSTTKDKLVKTCKKNLSSLSSTSKSKDKPKNVIPQKTITKRNDVSKQDSESVEHSSANKPPIVPSNIANKHKRSRKSVETDKLGKPAKGQEAKKQKMETDDTSKKPFCEITKTDKSRGQLKENKTPAVTPEKSSTVLPTYVPSSPDNSDDERGEYYSYLCVYCDYKANRRSDMKLHIADYQIEKFFAGTKPTSDKDVKKIKMKVRDILPICSSRAKNKKEKCPEREISTEKVIADEPSISNPKLLKEDSTVYKHAVSQEPIKKTFSKEVKAVESSVSKEKLPIEDLSVSKHSLSQESSKKKTPVSASTVTEKKGSSYPEDNAKESVKQKVSSRQKDSEKVSAKQKVSSYPKDKEKKLANPRDLKEQKKPSVMKHESEGLPIAVKKEKVTPQKVTPKQPCISEDESGSDIEIRRKRPKKSKMRRCFLSSSDEESEVEMKTRSTKPIVSPSGGRLTYCCHMCSYKAKSLYNFRLHLATHGTFTHLNADMSGTSWLRCGFCDFLAESKEDFSIHVEKHLDGRIYKCGYCKYDSYHSKNMKSHLKNKHRHKPTKIINLRDLLREKAQRPGSVAQLVNLDPELRLVDSLQNFSDILEEAGLKTLDMPLSMLPFLKQEDKHNIPIQIEYEDDDIIIDDEDDEDYVIVDETGDTDSDVSVSDDEESDDEESDGEDDLVFFH